MLIIYGRWGYNDVNGTREQVTRMREANIPLEGMSPCPFSVLSCVNGSMLVMWNDIDIYHAFRDFTTDPYRFPASEVKQFIEELVSAESNDDTLLRTWTSRLKIIKDVCMLPPHYIAEILMEGRYTHR